ncbi:hypothetical protein P4O66_000590 [Electrophorus voltai]|uniref:LRRNT domain-containing protein n=1 Tax=Electrophorus voltai TaxID=2609070 RepID=A0AAD8ZIF0_9TELE|nr:hypothetical protein P4O66_000590 [Electrophorus voltai]
MGDSLLMSITGVLYLVFSVGTLSPCPNDCKCTERNQLKMVHCVSRNLNQIPTDIPEDTVSLQLASNRITYIPSQAFKGLHLLQELDISNNAIEAVEEGAFQGISGGPTGLRLIQQLEVLRELQLNPDTVNKVNCHTAVREEYVDKPIIQVLDSGVNLCSFQRKTTDVAMLVTMFGWFIMVIAYVVYYMRQNQEGTRRHLEYLRALPSSPRERKDTDTISTVL